MATIVDGVRTKVRQISARAGVSGLGVKDRVADHIRGRHSSGLSTRDKVADFVAGRRKMGVRERATRVYERVRSTGIRRTGSLMLKGERPLRRWAGVGPRKHYVETGAVVVEDSSTGGDQTIRYRAGSRDQYLDSLDTKIRNIQS